MDRKGTRYNRRQFFTSAGSVAGSVASLRMGRASGKGVSIVLDPQDPVAAAGPAQWAAQELKHSLTARGVTVFPYENVSAAKPGDFRVLAAGAASPAAAPILKQAGATVAAVPEALGLIPGTTGKTRTLLACGSDTRGLVFALLDLVDRVQNAPEPLAALTIPHASAERPANVVRSVTRLFTSDVEDKPWYNDREMWPHYLTMLATQRFNRFNLAFGIGYDFIRQVTDGYFLFTYPFLLDVPGYGVRSPQLPDAERDRNLRTLKFISEETVARGMEFQVGLWMHGYEWIDSPNPNYTIEGLNQKNHVLIAATRFACCCKPAPPSAA